MKTRKYLTGLALILVYSLVNQNPVSAQEKFENASWISPSFAEPETDRPAPVFLKTFDSKKNIKSAILSLTAHGLYEASINGKRVGDGYFTPGYTAYQKRLQYQQYQVMDLLKANNEITVTIGDGWWRGTFGNGAKTNNYGKDASLLLTLNIQYTDGSKQEINSDNTWKSGTGQVLSNDLYHGETIDANKNLENLQPVAIANFSKNNLVQTSTPPVRKHEILNPKALIGADVIDFGQNLAGWVKIKVKGSKGDTIRIAHAETLDKDGKFFTGNLRAAKATDTYILKGGAEEVFEPHFTYHGFRYIKVSGTKTNLKDFQAIALYTDLKQTGTFSCSDAKLNQLQSNILWSMKSNFFDIPTDCPQRSERLGWNEDADVFCPTASYLMDVKLFYSKWLMDLAAEQNPSGCVPPTVPSSWGDNTRGFAGWGDAATFTPWTIYQRYGDSSILAQQYPSMKGWVDYVAKSSPDYLWKAEGFGDWYPAGPATDLPYLNQCYFYHSVWIMSETAKLLGKSEDSKKYAELLSNIKSAFDKTYLNNIPNTQTAYVIGLQFGLLPKEKIENLVGLIKTNNYHLSTGFMGTPYLMHVLSKYGQSETAYRLLFQTGVPSWMYMLDKGATTMWEQWDAIQPDGKIKEMSLNHYAFGSIGSWMYERIAGIWPAEPGYRKVIIAPEIGGGLTWAKGSYLSRYGKIASDWQLTGNKVTLKVEVPKGVTAEVQVPGGKTETVGAGKHTFSGQLN